MTSRTEILNEIIFYILERAKCAEDTDKYLEHVLAYCQNDYKIALKKRIKKINKANESND